MLKPGMIVKFSGCRDGVGLREIVEIKGESIVGRRLDLKAVREPREGFKFKVVVGYELEKTSYMSENSIKKIQMYFDELLDNFVKLKVI